jgi:hypothetical protein
MVLSALVEQVFPSHRGLTRDESVTAGLDGAEVWNQYHAMELNRNGRDGLIIQQQQRRPQDAAQQRSLPLIQNTPRSSSIADIDTSQQTAQEQGTTNVPLSTLTSTSPTPMPFDGIIKNNLPATRQRRKRCKATKCLASLAADFDVITDWVFYFHCVGEDRAYRMTYQNNPYGEKLPYLIPPVLLWIIFFVCVLGTIFWLTLATDGVVASPVLRFFGYDKLSMGYVLFLCVIVEDIPQVMLTFLVEDYFEENGQFNNYALVNVIASLYDTLIKLAEAFDERADIVETGIWCKER